MPGNCSTWLTATAKESNSTRRGSVLLCDRRDQRLGMERAAIESLGFNTVTKDERNISRQLCCSGLRKPARAAIRDSRCGICKSLTGSMLQTSPLQPLNEIFTRFSQPLHFYRVIALALDGFRPNGAPGTFPGAARKIRDAAVAAYLPARDLAANGLAVWPIRQLSSERRRARE